MQTVSCSCNYVDPPLSSNSSFALPCLGVISQNADTANCPPTFALVAIISLPLVRRRVQRVGLSRTPECSYQRTHRSVCPTRRHRAPYFVFSMGVQAAVLFRPQHFSTSCSNKLKPTCTQRKQECVHKKFKLLKSWDKAACIIMTNLGSGDSLAALQCRRLQWKKSASPGSNTQTTRSHIDSADATRCKSAHISLRPLPSEKRAGSCLRR